jgi:2-phospho-L-lactate guanylyltransferase
VVAAPDGFALVVPVKAPAIGKSRLVAPEGVDRGELAAAFATDAVRACLAADLVARVLVATDDASFAATAQALGAEVCPDGEVPGLNAALRHAAAHARSQWPTLVPVALCADLPALRSEELDAALAEVRRHPADAASYVMDADGTGTTMYAAAHEHFAPRFGERSATAHAGAGAIAVDGPLRGLRRDVDDVTTLRAALELGVGVATEGVLRGTHR